MIANDGGHLRDAHLHWSEEEFKKAVIALATARGWKVAHFRPARRKDGRYYTAMEGHKGYPDLTLARDGVVHHWELKVHPNKPSKEQEEWLLALRGACLYPADWKFIERFLE